MEPSKILLLLTFFVFSSVALAFAGSGSGAVIVTKDDNGKEISVPQGGIVEIRMEFPAGTGYSWEITDLDKNYLKLLDVSGKPLKEGPIAGGPVQKTWRIRAVSKGQTELKMYYYRVWEGLEKAADKFQLRIRIS
jgi:predicted secreted protein